MATVPRIDQQVNSQGLPNARFDSQLPKLPQVSGEIGADVAKAAGSVVSAASDYFEAEKKRADEIKGVEVKHRLAEAKNRLLYDPEKGALNKRGKDAFGLHESVTADFDKEADEIEQELSNETQRAQFSTTKGSYKSDLDNDINRHTSVETRKYDKEQTEGLMSQIATDSAIQYLDEDRLVRNIEEMEKLQRGLGERDGQSKEKVDMDVRAVTSKLHLATISQKLVNDMAPEAEAHFKKYGDSMDVGDRASIAKAIESGTILHKAREAAVELTGKHSNISAVQKSLDENSGLSDQVKEKALDMARERFAVKEAGQKHFKDRIFEQLSKKIEKENNFDSVQSDPSYWALDDNQRKALRSEWDSIMRGTDRKNNDEKYTEFLFKSQGELAAMSLAEYRTEYRQNFSKEYQNKADAMVNSAQTGDEKNQLLSPFSTYKDRFDDTLRMRDVVDASNPKKTDKDAKVYSQLAIKIREKVEKFEIHDLGGKRRATGEEIQKIIDESVIQKVRLNKPWASDPEKLVSILTDDEKGQAYVPYDDVPEGERGAIEKLFANRKRKVSRAQIERAYGAVILKDKKRLESILLE